jgi:hypothetical protein
LSAPDPRDQILSVANTILAKDPAALRTWVMVPDTRQRTEAFIAHADAERERLAPVFEAAERLRKILAETAGSIRA